MASVSLGMKGHYRAPGNPERYFDRIGAASVEMPNGRVITVAGEHGDDYDPDFCNYNDVIVRHGDRVEIYGYPRSTFPPTDFHTATIVDNDIYIVGSLGYPDERGGSLTPVFRLKTDNYQVVRVETIGESPGWIHRHRAKFLKDTSVIEITGGVRGLDHGDDERFRENFDTYQLMIDDGSWRRVTDNRDWRQFSLENEDDEKAWSNIGWLTGEVLKQLAYPCELYEEDEDEDEDAQTLTYRSHVIIVDGVRILWADRHDEIRITIQGQFEQSRVDDLRSTLKDLARGTHRIVSKIEEF